MDIPNTLFMHAMQTETQELFGFGKPGYDMILPVLAYSKDKKQWIRLP